jgi:hypothetical protein
MNESFPKGSSLENVILTPEESKLYEKCLTKYPEMTVMAFKELRENALKVRDTGAKNFYSFNGILVDKIPEASEIEELRIKAEN